MRHFASLVLLLVACRFDTSGIGPRDARGVQPDLGDDRGRQLVDGSADLGPATDLGRQDWLGDGWRRRKRIEIAPEMVHGATDLTRFPLLVHIGADAELASAAQPSAADLVFTASNGRTILPHEVERYDGARGEVVAWVRLPVLSVTEPTTLYLYYGNPSSSDKSQPAKLWQGTGCAAVWHLGDDPAAGSFIDAAGAHHGAARQSISASARGPGKVGMALTLDGSTHVIDVPPFAIEPARPAANDGVTLQAWLHTTSGNGRVVSKATGVMPHQHTWALDLELGRPRFRLKWVAGDKVVPGELYGPPLKKGQWHHVAATHDGQQMVILVDAAPVASMPAAGSVAQEPAVKVAVGGHPLPNDSRFFGGTLDEVRVCRVSRSTAWLKTELANQGAPSSYLKITAERR